MNPFNKLSFAVLDGFISITAIGNIGVQPASAVTKDEVISWAANAAGSYVKSNVVRGVAYWLKECAMSENCIRGQNISLITNRIPMDQVYLYSGNCFDPWNYNEASAVGRRMAVQISRKSGVPVIWSYYNNSRNGKGGEFVFGVPR
jgi:hypothetical protein